MNTFVSMPIIAYMHSPYREKFGIPRQPNLVNVQSRLKICSPYDTLHAFEGLEHFSHLWLIWQFNENKNQDKNRDLLQKSEKMTSAISFKAQIRPPRLGGNQKIGVFASRSMYRPSPIGLSVVKLVGLEQTKDGLWLVVEGADLLHGTPILDIKPYIAYADALPAAQSGYAQQPPERKHVVWQPDAAQKKQQALTQQRVCERHFDELQQLLSFDPRPAYQHDETRVYKLKFANLDVHFRVSECTVEIIDFTIEFDERLDFS